MSALETALPLTRRISAQPTIGCGLVVFDDPQERGAGTAYLSDTLPQRFRSVNDLRTDMLWVANVLDREISRLHPGLRATDYFGARLSDIAYDLGLAYARGYSLAAQDAVAIATIMSRAMTVAAKSYGWDLAGGALDFSGETLAEEISATMQHEGSEKGSKDPMASRFGHASQDRSVPNWTFERHDAVISVVLRFNRLAYARQLLAQRVPAGTDWTEAEPGQFIDGLPVIAGIAIDWSEANSDLAALAAFGRTGNRRQPLRLWACGAELEWLAGLCQLRAHTTLVNVNGYASLATALQMPVPLAVRSPLTMSYAAGLVGKAHLDAVFSIECYQSRSGRLASAAGAWLRAYDRAMMFSVACRAHAAGFRVQSYGDGEIRLRVSSDQLNELDKFKQVEGFMYPAVESMAAGIGVADIADSEPVDGGAGDL
ncbi:MULTISPECIES: hypothetical protein [unclassified Cupriavidus]|uniref:hypothetical protein n=1 Tax=unclassified Cupriavidus TaxID=2640874 RepID=UPI00313DB911